MNSPFNLNIKTPCSKDFNDFTPTKNGGFCGSCKHEVIDFTGMSAEETINYFKTKASKNTCGRFNKEQLRTYTPTVEKRRNISFISGIGLAIISLFSFSKAGAQNIKSQDNTLNTIPPKFQNTINEENITVKGTINDENGLLMPGVNILLEGTNIRTQSDFDGYFKFPKLLKKGDVLILNTIGYKSRKITIEDKDATLNISLKVNLDEMSCVVIGKVAVKKVYSSKK